MPNFIRYHNTSKNRDIRLASRQVGGTSGPWTIECAWVLASGESGYDRYQRWVDSTPEPTYAVSPLHAGDSIFYYTQNNVLNSQTVEPAEYDDVDLPPLQGPPIMGCECHDNWYACPINSPIDCASSPPC